MVFTSTRVATKNALSPTNKKKRSKSIEKKEKIQYSDVFVKAKISIE